VSLESYEGANCTLAEGSCIPFYDIITLPGRVHDQIIHETLIVRQLKEDAIVGMPFPEKHQCQMDFQKSAVVMAGKELVCVAKFGRLLVDRVQVARGCTVPGKFQATLCCRVNCKEITGLGLVDGMHGAIRVANSLNWLDCRRKIFLQCINLFSELVQLLAGMLVTKYYSIQETDMGPSLKTLADI